MHRSVARSATLGTHDTSRVILQPEELKRFCVMVYKRPFMLAQLRKWDRDILHRDKTVYNYWTLKKVANCKKFRCDRTRTRRRYYLFRTMTNKCTIISQNITLLHVSTASCHLQGVCNQCRAPWRWHDGVETFSSVIICEIIVYFFCK